MNERQAIQKWIQNYREQVPSSFAFKIPDTTKCAYNHIVATGKRPFDVITFDSAFGASYFEFKVAMTHNPAGALGNLLPHQIDALVRIGRTAKNLHGRAACIVYVPYDIRRESSTREFEYYFAGKDCNDCQLDLAPNHSVCKMCPYSLKGEPNYGGENVRAKVHSNSG